MSVYEYKCDTCGVEAEKNYPFAQAPSTTTCECGEEMRKVFGRTNIVLRGNGWAGRSSLF